MDRLERIRNLKDVHDIYENLGGTNNIVGFLYSIGQINAVRGTCDPNENIIAHYPHYSNEKFPPSPDTVYFPFPPYVELPPIPEVFELVKEEETGESHIVDRFFGYSYDVRMTYRVKPEFVDILGDVEGSFVAGMHASYIRDLRKRHLLQNADVDLNKKAF